MGYFSKEKNIFVWLLNINKGGSIQIYFVVNMRSGHCEKQWQKINVWNEYID